MERNKSARSQSTILNLMLVLVLLPCASLANAQEHVLFSFGNYTGDTGNPYSNIVADSAGNFYGTSFSEGAFDWGSVFELSPPAVKGGQWTETVLYSFTGGSDGGVPQSGLVIDSAGALYGTSPIGGSGGIVYKLTPPAVSGDPWTQSVIYTFTGGSDGGDPVAGLIFDKSGNLYGTTEVGGVNGGGTVFELSPPAVSGDPWTETVLYPFTASKFSFQYTHGCAPVAPVIFGPSGALYGTTYACGANDGGVVYKLAPPTATKSAWTHSVLHTFAPASGDGENPNAGVVMDSNGFLFGTTTFGGLSGEGTVYMLDPTSLWAETILFPFTGGADGGIPEGGVTLGSGGNLYGTTYNGGVHWGVIYRLTFTSSGWTETVPYTFTGGDDGGGPQDSMVLLNGVFYGTTEFGGTKGFGTSGKGTVFQFVP